MISIARPLRIEYSGTFYHVINRGLSRRDIFMEDKGRQSFLDLLSDITSLWEVEIYAYCPSPQQVGPRYARVITVSLPTETRCQVRGSSPLLAFELLEIK